MPKPPSSSNDAIADLDARVTELESQQVADQTALDSLRTDLNALEDRVTVLEGAVIDPPPIDPPPVITGTLSATLTFADGGDVVFVMADGVDMGNYVAPTAGFTQGCVRVKNEAMLNFFVDFRLDADGRAEIVFWNGECAGDVASGYTRDLPGYTATIADEAGTTHTETVPFHYWGSRWRWQSAPRPVIRSAAQVFSDGFLPHMSLAAARIEGYSGLIVPPMPPVPPIGIYSTFMPMDDAVGNRKLGLRCDVDGGGERPEIGLITEWQADWLVRGTESSLSLLLQQAEMCAGDWTIYAPDQVAGGPVDYKVDDAHYNMSTYQTNPGTAYIIQQGTKNGWDMVREAEAHTPNVFYVPYALTEDPYFLEAIQYVVQWGAGWDYPARQDVYPALGTRIVCSYRGEQRILGWGIRNLALAYKTAPPAAPPSWLLPQSYYAALSADYSFVLNHFYNTSTLPRHRVFHTIAGATFFQTFEQAYAIMGLALADLAGMPTGSHPSWKTHLDFYFGFIEGITNGVSGWNRQCPIIYNVEASDLDALPQPSWASAWAMWQPLFQNGTFPNAPSPGNQEHGSGSMGNCSQLVAACAMAKSRGVAAATAAKDWMDEFIDHNYPNNSDASMGIAFYAKCGFSG